MSDPIENLGSQECAEVHAATSERERGIAASAQAAYAARLTEETWAVTKRSSAEFRDDHVYIRDYGAKSVSAADLGHKLAEAAWPAERVRIVLNCAPARLVTISTATHGGKISKRWQSVQETPSVGQMGYILHFLGEQGFVAVPTCEPSYKLTPHPTDPYVGRLEVITQLVSGVQQNVPLGVRHKHNGVKYKANRKIDVEVCDVFAVNLLELAMRLDELGLLSEAFATGGLPDARAVEELLKLKIIGRDNNIVLPAASRLMLRQRFSELVVARSAGR